MTTVGRVQQPTLQFLGSTSTFLDLATEAVDRLKEIGPVIIWKHDEFTITAGTSWVIIKDSDEAVTRISGHAVISRLCTKLEELIRCQGDPERLSHEIPRSEDDTPVGKSNAILRLCINPKRYQPTFKDLVLWLRIASGTASHPIEEDYYGSTLLGRRLTIRFGGEVFFNATIDAPHTLAVQILSLLTYEHRNTPPATINGGLPIELERTGTRIVINHGNGSLNLSLSAAAHLAAVLYGHTP